MLCKKIMLIGKKQPELCLFEGQRRSQIRVGTTTEETNIIFEAGFFTSS